MHCADELKDSRAEQQASADSCDMRTADEESHVLAVTTLKRLPASSRKMIGQ